MFDQNVKKIAMNMFSLKNVDFPNLRYFEQSMDAFWHYPETTVLMGYFGVNCWWDGYSFGSDKDGFDNSGKSSDQDLYDIL